MLSISNICPPPRKACYDGEVDMCRYLHKRGAAKDVNAPSATGGFTPAMFAAMRGHVQVCKWLLEEAGLRGEDMRHSSEAGGFTPFM